MLSRLNAALSRRPLSSTAVVGAVANMVRLTVSLATMPALLSYLGAERFGLWLIALSFLGIIGVVNIGMSSAIITAMGRANAGAGERVENQAASAMAMALLLCLVTGAIILPLVVMVDWHSLFSLPAGISAQEVTELMAALAICLAIGFPARVPKFVLMGTLKGFLAHFIELLAVLAAAGALLTAIWLRQPLYILILVFLLPQSFLMLIAGGACLWRSGLSLSPSSAEWPIVLDLLKEGAKLTFNQASVAIANHSDMVLIGLIAGAGAAAIYGVVQRLFAVPVLLVSVLNDALWPAFSKADAEGRASWVSAVFVRLLVAMITVSIICGLGTAYFFAPITHLWLGEAQDASGMLLLGTAAWAVLFAVTKTAGTLLRALRETTFLTRAMAAMALVNVPVSLVLIHEMGAAGAIWGTVVAYSLCLVIPYAIFVPRLLERRRKAIVATEAASRTLPSFPAATLKANIPS